MYFLYDFLTKIDFILLLQTELAKPINQILITIAIR